MTASTSLPSQGPPPGYTRFERARILGARALQISLGAPMLVELSPEIVDPVTIAEMEFSQGVIPITVRRGGETPAGGLALKM